MNKNAHPSLPPLLGTLPDGVPVQAVTVLHPDPWFKKRHVKRRVVSAEFMDDLAGYLPGGARVHLQTDVPELFTDLQEQVGLSPLFTRLPNPTEPPFGVKTPREEATERKGLDVYRLAYERIHG